MAQQPQYSRLSNEDLARAFSTLGSISDVGYSMRAQALDELQTHIAALTAEADAKPPILPDDPALLADVLRGPKACEKAILDFHEKSSSRDISDPHDDLDAFWSCFETVLQGLLASGKPLLPAIEAATAVAQGLHVPS